MLLSHLHQTITHLHRFVHRRYITIQHTSHPYNEAKYNVVFSVTDAVLLEAIDPLLLVMQRTEGAVTAPPPEQGQRIINSNHQTTARFPFYEGHHHITRGVEQKNVMQNYC